uniref:Putative secreted protein n=1 Tax=Amblyomma cajennense TaxID=34607 RepID=A0A023FCF5_AMBCJ
MILIFLAAVLCLSGTKANGDADMVMKNNPYHISSRAMRTNPCKIPITRKLKPSDCNGTAGTLLIRYGYNPTTKNARTLNPCLALMELITSLRQGKSASKSARRTHHA